MTVNNIALVDMAQRGEIAGYSHRSVSFYCEATPLTTVIYLLEEGVGTVVGDTLGSGVRSIVLHVSHKVADT